MTTLKLYGPGFSYYLRAMRQLCRFKGISHEVTSAPFGEEMPFFSDRHAELHPYRKLPVLIEGSLVIPETMAIALYLESKPGPGFIPGDAADRAKVLSSAGIISLYIHQFLIRNVLLEFAFPKGDEGKIRFDVVDRNIADANRALAWVADALGTSPFFTARQFTLCDAYLIPMLDYLDQLPSPYNLINAFPNLWDYLGFHRQQAYSEGILGPR